MRKFISVFLFLFFFLPCTRVVAQDIDQCFEYEILNPQLQLSDHIIELEIIGYELKNISEPKEDIPIEIKEGYTTEEAVNKLEAEAKLDGITPPNLPKIRIYKTYTFNIQGLVKQDRFEQLGSLENETIGFIWSVDIWEDQSCNDIQNYFKTLLKKGSFFLATMSEKEDIRYLTNLVPLNSEHEVSKSMGYYEKGMTFNSIVSHLKDAKQNVGFVSYPTLVQAGNNESQSEEITYLVILILIVSLASSIVFFTIRKTKLTKST